MSDIKIHKEEITAQKMYGKEGTLPIEDFIREFNVNKNGLSSEEAELRKQKYGLNEGIITFLKVCSVHSIAYYLE